MHMAVSDTCRAKDVTAMVMARQVLTDGGGPHTAWITRVMLILLNFGIIMPDIPVYAVMVCSPKIKLVANTCQAWATHDSRPRVSPCPSPE